ncbi:MAG: alpha/beta hydrolase [Burkholderiaceae bacterium]|jgi:pimeloyl-ACP methyl ester carboxylesterase
MEISILGKSTYAYTGGKPWRTGQPAALFIHGAQHDHSVWTLQSRYLAHHGMSVLAVDLPGHGRSSGEPLRSVEELAAWVIEILKTLEIEGAALIGHSMGSLIALEAAFQARERISKVALISTAFPMKVSESLLDAATDDEPRALDMINLWSHSAREGGFSHKPSYPGPGFGLMWGNLRLMERQRLGVLHVDFSACNAYQNAAALDTDVPALFILGERDAMTPARSGAAMAARLPRHEIVTIARAGHAVMAEAPDAVLKALKEFLLPSAP